MFLTLLLVTFLISASVSLLVVWLFTSPIGRILKRIIADDISDAWVKYITFGLYVVGISSGVRINQLERYYITRPPVENAEVVSLTFERWVLEGVPHGDQRTGGPRRCPAGLLHRGACRVRDRPARRATPGKGLIT